MDHNIIPEILSPAGSMEALRAAVNAGADAVYVGGRLFGARAYADNPSESELIEGIEYCHLRGKKLYLTINTLLKEEELRTQLYDFLLPLYRKGVDAVLVQDLGVLKFIREHFPELPLHASTQMSVSTPEGARLLQRYGISRVVPARELTLREIQEIVQTGIEVETFVHGAMCYSYSGRCLYSSMLGGRSGNRGRCAQPCRLPYLVEASDGEPVLRLSKKAEHKPYDACYPLSMKDLCTLDLIPDLMDAGIVSFKIEGRMKPPQYAAGVTAVYRKYRDLYLQKGREGYSVEEEDRRILLDLFDRGGFSKGYYRTDGSSMITMTRPRAQSAQSAQQKNEKNQRFLKENSKVKINGVLRIYPGIPVILELWTALKDFHVEVAGGIPESARSASATAQDVAGRIRKTGGTEFEFEHLTVDLADGLFLPVSMLNDLRREGLQKLRNEILSGWERPADCLKHQDRLPQNLLNAGLLSDKEKHTQLKKYNILVTMPEQLDAFLTFLKECSESSTPELFDTVYLDSCLFGNQSPLQDSCRKLEQKMEALHSMGLKCFFACPPVFRSRVRDFFADPCVCELFSRFDGFLVSSVDELEFLRNQFPNSRFVSEDCLYAANTEARAFFRGEGIIRFILPAELNARELREVVSSDSELILYGYQPLMQSAQCVRRNTMGCVKREKHTRTSKSGAGEYELLYLRDRRQVRFPVLTRCRFCTNTVYNSVPLRLFGCGEQLQKLQVPYLRLSFTVESAEETMRILRTARTFIAEFDNTSSSSEQSKRKQPDTEGTRGHFKRGVE